MKKISSVHNDEVKAIAQLSTKKGRLLQQRFIAEGYRTCLTLLSCRLELIQLYATEELLSAASELSQAKHITLVEQHVLEKMSAAQSPSGLLAVFKIPKDPDPSLLTSGIVLYDCSDPGNMGTLIRTCSAMDKKTVVIIDGVDPWSPKVIQASAGTIGGLYIFQWTWADLMRHKNDKKLCALVVSGGKRPDEINFSDMLIVVGNEAHGIPEHIMEQCELLVTLEMPGKIESLNAAVAGSIALYLARNK